MIDNRTIQAYLNSIDLYRGKIDGVLGVASMKAINQALIEHDITVNSDSKRMVIAIQQLMFIAAGVDRSVVGKVDGFDGPMFRAAFEIWQDFQRLAPMWCPPVQTSQRWPKQSDVESFYGPPGENLVRIKTPYPLYTEWSREHVSSLQVNKLCAQSLEKVLLEVRTVYGTAALHLLGLDVYSGGFIIRPMKGTTSRLSMHAYGIAFDFDSLNNQLRWTRAQARFARPEYEPWLDAWRHEGWISLGVERDMDYMHFQAARLS